MRPLVPSLCIAVIDIDHFKAINDAHGHDAGRHRSSPFCATSCRERVRAQDLLGRMGGEEFLLLLPRCRGSTMPCRIIDRIRDRLPASLARRGQGFELPCTFSAG